jgi:hypothetical protein
MGRFSWCRETRLKSVSTAFFAALAGVLLVVGGHATLQAAHLAVRGGETHAFWGDRARGGFAIGFGAEFFGHFGTPVGEWKNDDYPSFRPVPELENTDSRYF